MAQVPQNKIEQIRDETDLVEVVSRYVDLRLKGKYYWGLCPFHNEKTPSFHVSQEKQLYYCFGCQSGGDVFKFLQSIEQLDFLETCHQLADELGIELPAFSEADEEKSHVAKEKDRIKSLNKYTANFFRYILMNSDTGKVGKKYLADRGIDTKIASDFFLGFAPDSWTGLSDFLKKKGFEEDLLVKAGLCNNRKQGGVYDKFRGRVIFPIYNIRGEILGFGGRLLKEQEEQPKYLNSPETPVFNKRQVLYGLNIAFKTIRRQNLALIVEGYTDVITAHQYGFSNTVASLGTALTEEQAKLIRKNASNVYIAYDADAAGQTATLRGLEILRDQGLDVFVCDLPTEYDPDDYLKEFGADSFQRKVIDTAIPLVEYQLRQAANNKNLSSIEGKKEYVTEIIPVISKIDNAVEREAYLNTLATWLDISQEALNSELGKHYNRTKIYGKSRGSGGYSKAGGKASNRNNTRSSIQGDIQLADNRTTREKAEESLVSLMIHHPEYIKKIKNCLYPEDFSCDNLSLIVHKIYQLAEDHIKGVDLNKLINELRDYQDVENTITRLSIDELPEPKDPDKFINDCVFRIKASKIKSQREELQKELSQINPESDPEKYREILRQLQEYLKLEKNKQWTLEEGG